MRLAGHLGMTLRELHDRMSADEFALWQEFYFREPFGEERYQLALLTATVVNSSGFRKPDAPLITPDLFLPQLPKPAREQGPQEQRALGAAIVSALGGKPNA
jgi:hypothetical protein